MPPTVFGLVHIIGDRWEHIWAIGHIVTNVACSIALLFFLSVDVCCFTAAERVVFRRYREIPQLIGGWFTSGKRTLACVYLICASQRFEPLGLRPGIPFR